jgi:hypothetical protein
MNLQKQTESVNRKMRAECIIFQKANNEKKINRLQDAAIQADHPILSVA